MEGSKEPLPEPKFGDMLHVNGGAVVVIGTSVGTSQTDFIKLYTTVSVSGFKTDYRIADFDEYMPDKTQELRKQVLKDWQQQGIDFAYDTEQSEYVMHLSDVIDFIVDHGYSKAS